MADEQATPVKRQRKPQRRSYRAEFAALQATHADLASRVYMALLVLRTTSEAEANSPAAKQLVAVAIKTLEGTDRPQPGNA